MAAPRGDGSGQAGPLTERLARMTLAERIAQLIMVGVPTVGLTDECREFFADRGFGGAIIFGRNCVDLAQVRRLTDGLQDLVRSSSAGLPLLIATDQEGGIVARLTEANGAVVMPGAMALGATGDPGLARRAAAASARLLRSVGINMNLAPVADVNNAHNNPVINVRSFGEDPERVGAFVAAAIDGCQAAGVLATAKHFPGHGDTAVDSHLAMPIVPHDWTRLSAVELVPFRAALAADVGAVMTSHILFPALASDGLPATLSRPVLTGLLRETLGHRGLIISDCLEMNAIVANFGTADAARRSIQAGADIVCVSHTPARQREAYASILGAAEAGEIDPIQIEASVRRILLAKERYALASAPPLTASESAAQAELALGIARRAVTLVRDRRGELPLAAAHPLCALIGLGPLSAAESAAHPVAHLADALREFYPDISVASIADDGTGLNEALSLLTSADALVLAVSGASARPERARHAETLRGAAADRPVILAGCRSPYDAEALSDVDAALVAYDERPAALRAMAEVIAGRRSAPGRLPVRLATD